jgi:hypothetical protein
LVRRYGGLSNSCVATPSIKTAPHSLRESDGPVPAFGVTDDAGDLENDVSLSIHEEPSNV